MKLISSVGSVGTNSERATEGDGIGQSLPSRSAGCRALEGSKETHSESEEAVVGKKGVAVVVLGIVFLAGVVCSTQAAAKPAADAKRVKLLGRFDDGPSHTVSVEGDYAYLESRCDYEPCLAILGISDPTSPRVVGKTEPLSVRFYIDDIAVAESGRYAYIVDIQRGISIVDVSEPTNPRLAAMYSNPIPEPSHAVISDTKMYVVGGEQSYLRILDISTPVSPTLVGSCDTPTGDNYGPRDVYVDEGTAYVAVGWDGLRIVDIQYPGDPREVGQYRIDGEATADVCVRDDIAYVVGEKDDDGWLTMLDVSDPANPQEIGRYEDWEHHDPRSIALSGDYAYVASGIQGGLRIVDISNPSSPTEAGYYVHSPNPYGYGAWDVVAIDNTAYLAYNRILFILRFMSEQSHLPLILRGEGVSLD